MSYSFEYIDIILLAMIAGFIFLRLRGILGKRSGFEGKAPTQFDKILKEAVVSKEPKKIEVFDVLGNKIMELVGNSINMEHLSSATYIVNAVDVVSQESLSYKVIKK